MIYVMSDLHGYPIEKFLKILESINFSSDDFLYLLGDVIDRGKDGVKLLKWLMQNRNTQLLLGNHEKMMLDCEFMFEEGFIPDNLLYGAKRNSYAIWSSNGGIITIDALNGTRAAELKYIFEYLKNAPLYKKLTVNGREFVLTHSGFENFSEDKPLDAYTAKELVWHRPTRYTDYFKDIITIFGHTPTALLDPASKGRAFHTETWIDIDVGAGMGNAPMVLRLDDLKEFYFD